jgi:hypothetical protein
MAFQPTFRAPVIVIAPPNPSVQQRHRCESVIKDFNAAGAPDSAKREYARCVQMVYGLDDPKPQIEGPATPTAIFVALGIFGVALMGLLLFSLLDEPKKPSRAQQANDRRMRQNARFGYSQWMTDAERRADRAKAGEV